MLKYAVARKGILSLNPTLVYVFWKSDESVDNYDLQLTFTPASYKEGVQSKLDDFPGMTIASWQQRPDSIGWVRARSADPFEHPVIQPNYLAAESDRRVLLAGMKLARRLLSSPALSKYYDREEFPGPQAQTDEDLMGAAKQRGTTTFHLMGTCRMAPDTDPSAVVDDQLRVRGIDGAARDRCFDHADHAVGQPQRLGADDRGEGRRHDSRQAGARGRDVEGLRRPWPTSRPRSRPSAGWCRRR